MRVLVDTNVLLREYVRTDVQHTQVHALLGRLMKEGRELCIGVQNVIEFWVVATRPTDVNGLGLDINEVRAHVQTMLSAFTLLPDSSDIVARWLDLCTLHTVTDTGGKIVE